MHTNDFLYVVQGQLMVWFRFAYLSLFIMMHYFKSIYTIKCSKKSEKSWFWSKGTCMGSVPPSTTDCQCGIRQHPLV